MVYISSGIYSVGEYVWLDAFHTEDRMRGAILHPISSYGLYAQEQHNGIVLML
jgi:hypothetical protein